MGAVTKFGLPVTGRSHLLEEAHHRIANHLAIAVGMVNAQISALRQGPEMLPRDAAERILQDTTHRILGISRLHRRLMRQPDAGLIDLSDFLIETIQHFALALSLGNRLSVRQSLGSGCFLRAERAHTLSLIVGEVILNAAKHAHPTGIPIEMSVVCETSGDGIAVEICDDGVGLPEGFDAIARGGLGLGLIRTLARSIGARLRIESSELGLCFQMFLDADRETGNLEHASDRIRRGLRVRSASQP